MTPGQWKTLQKVAQMCRNVSEKYYASDLRNPKILPICHNRDTMWLTKIYTKKYVLYYE